MAGKFEQKLFSEININDPLFASLKADYPEFAEQWFPKCIRENRKAVEFSDVAGLGAFIALKREENEPIPLQNGEIPAAPRLKIATLLLAERFRGQRLGEGALGLVLWYWQRSKLEEIYVTIFPSHMDLITQVERFGFRLAAEKTFEHLKTKAKSLPTMTFLAEVKFDKVGIDPLEGTELNFIEQINQTFSDLVVLEGASQLLQSYPNTTLKLHFGSASGFDIESADGEVVAECFAVTTATSNRKIERDCSKLMSKAHDKQKYIYFYSRNDSDEKLRRIMDKYPEIAFVRIAEFTP